MRTHTIFATAALLAAVAIPAFAQVSATGARPGHEIGDGTSLPLSDKSSNNTPNDTHSEVAPTLPSPGIGDDATSREYLMAARQSLKAGKTGRAQQSMEMAETRLLDRSTVQFQTNDPSRNPLVDRISAARHALGNGDRQQAMNILDGILSR